MAEGLTLIRAEELFLMREELPWILLVRDWPVTKFDEEIDSPLDKRVVEEVDPLKGVLRTVLLAGLTVLSVMTKCLVRLELGVTDEAFTAGWALFWRQGLWLQDDDEEGGPFDVLSDLTFFLGLYL